MVAIAVLWLGVGAGLFCPAMMALDNIEQALAWVFLWPLFVLLWILRGAWTVIETIFQ